ncbi:MAG: hypothetical protein WC655_29420, partial [Candidatus Hydrogenedentales bacterium]
IFLFVAGMGFRLSILRNIEKEGLGRALLAGLRRYALLTLIGIVYYSPLDWGGWWDALVDIGLSGLLALPFIALGTKARVAAAAGYMALYQLLYSYGGYGPWVMAHSYDGGPLGPLSWVFCLLLGTVAYDLVATHDTRKIVIGCLAWGIGLSIAGWAFRAEWPGVKEFWPFSQTGMSAPYPIYATGLAFLTFLIFYVLSDLWRIEIPTLTVFGANPLVLYILHGMYIDIHGNIVPSESGIFMALLAFAGLYLMCYAVARYMYTHRMFVKIG